MISHMGNLGKPFGLYEFRYGFESLLIFNCRSVCRQYVHMFDHILAWDDQNSIWKKTELFVFDFSTNVDLAEQCSFIRLGVRAV